MCSCLHHTPVVFLIASISRDTCILNKVISGMHAWSECVTALCICCYGDVFDVISLVSSEHLSRWEVNISSQWHGRIKQLLVSSHQQDWTKLGIHLLKSLQSSDLRAGHQHCGLSVVLRWNSQMWRLWCARQWCVEVLERVTYALHECQLYNWSCCEFPLLRADSFGQVAMLEYNV